MNEGYTYWVSNKDSTLVSLSSSPLFGQRSSCEDMEVINNLVVDMHGHWLPDADDGLRTVSEAVEFIRGMQKLGFKKLIATPHIMFNRYENNYDVLTEKYYQVVQALLNENFKISLCLAGEYMLDEGFSKYLKNGDLLTIGNEYVLIELCPWYYDLSLPQTLFEIQMQGYVPVLAHPERYHYINGLYPDLEKLKNFGCRFQLNMLSLAGFYGRDVKRRANYILEKGWYEFAGSDIHSLGQLETLRSVKLTNNFLNYQLL